MHAAGKESEISSVVEASVEKYGIHAYRVLRKSIRGTGLQAHHLIEKRFAATLEMKASEIPSIALPKVVHQVFTNLWRNAISYGEGTLNATKENIIKAVERIYKDFPGLLDKTTEYLNSLDSSLHITYENNT